VKAKCSQGRVIERVLTLLDKNSHSHIQPLNLPPHPIFQLYIWQLDNSLMVLKELCTPLVQAIFNQGRVVVDIVTLLVKYRRSYPKPQNLLLKPVFSIKLAN
jgi:hypothetical protein